LRETVAAVRHIIKGAHTGLTPFEGEYYRASFRELQPTQPPVRDEIPIWIAALRAPLVRLAVPGNDAANRAVGGVLPQHDVAAALADTAKAQPLKSSDGLLA
jgi:hypothetical protein